MCENKRLFYVYISKLHLGTYTCLKESTIYIKFVQWSKQSTWMLSYEFLDNLSSPSIGMSYYVRKKK